MRIRFSLVFLALLIGVVSSAAQITVTGAGGSGGFTPVFDANWWQHWQAAGTNPSVVLDFEHALYWDGTQTLSSPSTMVGGSPTIDSSGLLANSTTITGIGNLLSALEGSAFSMQLQLTGGTASSNLGVISTNSVDGPFTQDAANTIDTYNGSVGLQCATTLDFTSRNFVMMSTNASGRNITAVSSTGAIVTNSDANTTPAVTSMQIGSFNGGQVFGGHFPSLAAVNAVWSNQSVAPPAFTGTNGFFGGGNTNAKIDYGNVLQYEYTQPWTVIAAINLHDTGASGAVIFSNVAAGPAFPGYELWIDTSARLRIRVIHDISANLYLGVIGTTNLADKKWHVVSGAYGGCGSVSCITMYVDGNVETQTTEIDALGGNTIKGANDYIIGNQTGSGFGLSGAIGMFRQYNVVKSQGFIQDFKLNYTMPPVDATCDLGPKLNEGGSNTTTGDNCHNNLTGTLSSTAVWLRG